MSDKVKPRRPKSDYQIVNQAVSLFAVNDTERKLISFLNSNGKDMGWVHPQKATTLIEGLALELGHSEVMVKRAIASLRKRGWVRLRPDHHGNPAIQLERAVVVREAALLQQIRQYRRWIGVSHWSPLMHWLTPEEKINTADLAAFLWDLYQRAADLGPEVSPALIAGGTKERMAYIVRQEIKARMARLNSQPGTVSVPSQRTESVPDADRFGPDCGPIRSARTAISVL